MRTWLATLPRNALALPEWWKARLPKDEAKDKGVTVRTVAGGLVCDLHIAVTYGVNIAAIVKSIVNKVRYTVEEATGLQVAKVNVFVDDMKQ